MLEKVTKTIQKYRLFRKGESIVIGVSGGPDSVTLLHLLDRLRGTWQLKLYVAHFNHMFREEAFREADFVSSFARRLGLPVTIGQRDVPRYMEESGLSAQEAARDLRYDFLEEVAEKTNSTKIAVAHHADDQAETILINFLRGASPAGLAGIPPQRGKIIRPLLDVTREEIESYCSDYNLSSCLDPSNLKPVYLRNRIRLELIPFLKKYNPNLVDGLNNAARIFREEDRYLGRLAENFFWKYCKREQGKLLIFWDKYASLPLALKRRLIRIGYRELAGSVRELGFGHVDQIVDRLEKPLNGKKSGLPGDIIVRFDGSNIIFQVNREKHEEVRQFDIKLKLPGKTLFPGGAIVAVVLDRKQLIDQEITRGDPRKAFIDFAQIKTPVKIRNRRPGDRFYPLGLKGSKKLKEFLIDLKIPRQKRNLVALLTSGNDEIAWVVGLRLDERFKITDSTDKILLLKYSNSNYANPFENGK